MENTHLARFQESVMHPGEAVIAWMDSVRGGGARVGWPRHGVAVLTERRLCFYADGEQGELLQAVSVCEPDLRYLPRQGEPMVARFETTSSSLEFAVDGEAGLQGIGLVLGNLKDLRDLQHELAEKGVDVATLRRRAGEAPLEYRLLQLKEMVRKGLFNDFDYLIQRGNLIDAALA